MRSSSPARLGVLTVGMGAVSTTLFAGVEAMRRGQAAPIGSLTQLGQLPLTAPPGTKTRKVSAIIDLAPLDGIVFGGWDVIETDARAAAVRAGVLTREDLARHGKFLRTIVAFPGVANPRFTVRVAASRVKPVRSLRAQVEAIRADIRAFRRRERCTRLVVLCAMSVEAYVPPSTVHRSLAAFEAGLRSDDPAIAPSQLYAYAALREGAPFVNGTPNVTAETPALQELARRAGVPLAGSDFKSGQTYLKTVIAAGLRNRLLGLDGWFSTNILGNRDGDVLEDPQAFAAKRATKTGVLADICRADLYPELYRHIEHLVKINYYPPRGDNKEAWDSVDLRGWLGYPMQIKINFQCRDSILAAPLALDLVLLADAAARAGASGLIDWLGFFFKSPVVRGARKPSNDPNLQLAALEREIGRLAARRRRTRR
ncbi:MAG TPA: inositol-3-phosphate synthase [Opitutaceae bacterium]|nr:inositol-3-phosphate synthase [Opitutaceae bacterium]